MSNKGWRGNYFEDFKLGSVLDCPIPRTITEGDVAQYIALTGDRTSRYCGPYRLVHPLLTFHAAFGQTVRQISLNAQANLGYAGLRWLKPVRIGDTLSVQIEIVGLKENSSGKTGIVYVHNIVQNHFGVEVMRFWRWVMVRKRGEEPTAFLKEPVIPELPKQIKPSELDVFSEVISKETEAGGRWSFEDYQKGERIFHYDGMTLNHSDHMNFTRLFQNSAKVHFDSLAMNGKPLIYGGVPISIGYALSLNGLENRLGVCGINSGAHTSPIFSGDTIYVFTDVIEKVRVGEKVGALRLRLIACKNLDPSALEETFTIQSENPARPGRLRYHENVILDLDYWELMPYRATLETGLSPRARM